MTDKIYAMSSFLQFRTVYDDNVKFDEKLDYPRKANVDFAKNRISIKTSDELYDYVKSFVEKESAGGKTALALSSGIDSAICAAFMQKGSVAYTFRCVVPNKQIIDETETARKYCEINKLEHRIVDIFWEDYEKLSPILIRYNNEPIHSIDVQIYKATLQAKKDGFNKLIFGHGADLIYGGFDQLLSKDWTIGEFIDRYSCILPYKVLKKFTLVTEPFEKWSKDGFIDLHGFLDSRVSWGSIHSYYNSCALAGIQFAGAYMNTIHSTLDYNRVRSGESKYLVREVFKRLYPNKDIPKKIPMPRPMDEWFENWEGPKRSEFWPNCHANMTGDQKYYIWILEKFLEEFDL